MEVYVPQGTGYLADRLSDEELSPIKEEIAKIQFNNFDGDPHNSKLVGHIRKEFTLHDSHDYIEQLVGQRVMHFENQFKFLEKNNVLTDDLPIKLLAAWVNFQEKYEFNPMHNHTGLLSFVIWIRIPYTEESEMAVSPGVNSAGNMSGKFQIAYNSPLGGIVVDSVEQHMQENCMILFPASLYHCVYPFYSSDDYRISVSGNFSFDTSYAKYLRER